ncbi:Decaprenyl diphosphate synthase-like protein [Calycomorphotria hydatis]|uniref:Isoprenyl transferase n=2 Tax=Calycomorphotria hydatis TaxID=2528027 RepID=A0A517T6M9_9PLAN|nr:Decaprenyl diphosphate synthase-like protein [Calycomorphotria hydatis]
MDETLIAAEPTSSVATEMLNRERIPRHVAIIMDGNGRWARQQGLPRSEGHLRGAETVRMVIEECTRLGLEQLTLYCFSSENWKRPVEEQSMLMELLRRYVIAERPELMEKNLRMDMIGRRSGLPEDVLGEVDTSIECTRSNTGMRLCLALNYGGRGELTDAVCDIAAKVKSGELQPEDISEKTITDHLYTAGMSDPDLVIRTAGEMRVSNFLLWQISYAELWVTDKPWPIFERDDLFTAFRDYIARDRRFGGLSS